MGPSASRSDVQDQLIGEFMRDLEAADEEGPLQYFVMPYIDGAALHHVIRAARDLETAQPHSKTPPLKDLAERAAKSKPDAADTPAAAIPTASDVSTIKQHRPASAP